MPTRAGWKWMTRLWMACVAAMACAGQLDAAIAVEGLTDRLVSWEPVRFRAMSVDGCWDTATLDAAPVAAGEWTRVELPGYHEFVVTRTALTGGSAENARFQFIILDPLRGTTETGLPPWTPRPAVPSAPEEFPGAQLALVVPRTFPSGLRLPVIGRVQDGNGGRVGVNGVVEVTGRDGTAVGLTLRRGIGFAFLPPGGGAGEVQLMARAQGLNASAAVVQDEGGAWVDVAGDVVGSTIWPAAGRVSVSSNVTVRTGATLTVGAGAVVRLAPGVEITVEGAVEIRGTLTAPVVFLPQQAGKPWGGFVLLGRPARVEATGSLFTGAGANARFYLDRPLGGSHRVEQPAFHLGPGTQAVFRDCWFVELAGQALHGEQADLVLERCLVQRCLTVGQFNGGSVQIRESALLEFPADDPEFVDGDNDAIYLTLGTHRFSDTLIGWAKDDGIDAGGDSPGDVRVERCWFESCFHEGMALSGTDKLVSVSDSVFLNNGQGVEAGYLSPRVTVTDSLLVANGVGARFGDNYSSSGAIAHAGFLRVTNSFLLNNGRDIWGMVLSQWEEAVDRMDLEGNRLSVPHPAFPRNTLWNGTMDGAALRRFRNPGSDRVGLGFLAAESRWPNAAGEAEVWVGLSSFSEREVRVEFRVEGLTASVGVDVEPVRGTRVFTPGETVRAVRIPLLANPGRRFSTTARLVLENPQNASCGAGVAAHHLRLLTLPVEGDQDADGLPDDWERALLDADRGDAFDRLEQVHPDADFDGDGFANRDEYLAGTDATNAGDGLHLRVKGALSGALVLEFEAVPGRTYRLETGAALGPTVVWQSVWELAAAAERGPREVRQNLVPGSTAGFYRLVVLPRGFEPGR